MCECKYLYICVCFSFVVIFGDSLTMSSFLIDLESAFASLGESILPVPPSRPSGVAHKQSTGPVFSVALLGESSVGKSCLFSVFCADEYQPGLASSDSHSTSLRDVALDSQSYRLRVTDHPGHVRHREAVRAGLAKFDAFVVVYDVSLPESLAAVEGWVDDIRRHSRCGLEECPIVMAGNKCDLASPCVSLEQAQVRGFVVVVVVVVVVGFPALLSFDVFLARMVSMMACGVVTGSGNGCQIGSCQLF